MSYDSTTLWQTAFSPKNDGNDKLREELCKELIRCRSNAIYLLDKIRKDFPSLTIHDITHVDGLWQVASVIVGPQYSLNPLEGFVLGIAFLMHDAALSYQAVGGKKILRETIEWKDNFADYKNLSSMSEDERLYETDFQTIRFLHAKNAETLYRTIFERKDGTSFFIVENESLRNHLGKLSCKIAASHHWNIDSIESLGGQIPAPAGYPQEWRINPIKLACIIRCADAGHIDGNRAPDYLLKLLSINGISRAHWLAQNRLSQIDTDINDPSKVIIASNIDFPECDFAAWNVASDAVMVLNHELKISNEILAKIDKKLCFMARTVSGAGSRAELSKYIKTEGWMPCDANIHISNVENLIKNLGGDKLYGVEHKIEVVLRELIQNARDAISARRIIDPEFEGKILVNINNVDGKYWFSVVDNGVGMSMQTILDYLLNFGNSFWGSDLAKKEYPGLRSSNFESIGTFGIGFYSLFMVASEVIVDSRKFDSSIDSNIRLKFPNGLCLRPIVSNINGLNMNISTIIKFSLDDNKVKWEPICKIKPGVMGIPDFEVPYKAVLAKLTAGLDVDVYYSEMGSDYTMIHNNIEAEDLDICQWLIDISYADFHEGTKYVDYIKQNYQRLTKITHNGKMYGFAALNTMYQKYSSFMGVNTIGGLDTGTHNSGMEDFIGIIYSEPKTAKRDPVYNKSCLKNWMKDQYEALLQKGLSDIDRLNLPYIVSSYDINMSDELKVRVIRGNTIFTLGLVDLLSLLKNSNGHLVFPLASFCDDRITVYTDIERTLKMLGANDYLFIPESNTNFLNLKDNDSGCPFNILTCLKVVAKLYNFELIMSIENNRIYENLGGIQKGFVIMVI